jgi:cleavage and polyadenylation specificity factor subunit 1
MEIDEEDQSAIRHQILMTSSTGAISLITPLPDSRGVSSADSYRSLAALQTYLTSTLPHPLGLSPKAYRNVEVDMSIGGRAMLDGNVLRRWMELGSWKRAEGVARIGSEGEWEVKALLEGILGSGLGFL